MLDDAIGFISTFAKSKKLAEKVLHNLRGEPRNIFHLVEKAYPVK